MTKDIELAHTLTRHCERSEAISSLPHLLAVMSIKPVFAYRGKPICHSGLSGIAVILLERKIPDMRE
jgi:hypothetical protein